MARRTVEFSLREMEQADEAAVDDGLQQPAPTGLCCVGLLFIYLFILN